MSLKYFIIIAFLFIGIKVFCQNSIEVIYKGELLDGPDGLCIDNKGNLFISNWGKKGKGSTVVKIDTNNNAAIYITNLKSPDGLVWHKGKLYISNFASGEISKNKRNKTSHFTSIEGSPAGLVFDKKENLYIADYGNWNGSKVYRIDKKGTRTIFADSLEVPLGLIFDERGNLYVSCFGSGNIYKINPIGEKIIFASIPNNPKSMIQYLAFDKDSNLLVPSYGHNCIYKINSSGQIIKMANFKNDQTNESYQLSGPNSIANRNGEIIITEFNKNTVLKIQYIP